MAVYTFGRGGVGAVATVAVVQLAPTVVLSPLAAYAGDRFRTEVVLAAGYGVQAASMAATAALIAAGAADALVYAAAAVVALGVSFTGPAIGTLLPRVVAVPADLTAATAGLGVLGQLGTFAGPALAGALLVAGPALVFVVMAVAVAVAAALAVGLDVERPPAAGPDIDVGFLLQDALAGFRTLREDGDLRLVVLVGTIGPAVVGVTDVLFVTIADGPLGGDAGGAGLLGAAFGLGSLLGAFGSVALVGNRRLMRPLVAAFAVCGLAIAAVGSVAHVVPVVLGFVVCGGGQSLGRIADGSIIPRLAPPARLARVYGVVEGLESAAIAVGSVAVSALVAWWGIRPATLVVGLLLPALLLALRRSLRRVDEGAAAPDPVLLRLVEAVPLFAGLTPRATERLLASMEEVAFGGDVAVVRAGDEGDRYFLVTSGALAVTVGDRLVRRLGPGDGFGEIALLRDVPRTATITTTEETRLYSVRRDDFLAAVTGHPGTRRAADAHVQRLLDDDRHRDGGAP